MNLDVRLQQQGIITQIPTKKLSLRGRNVLLVTVETEKDSLTSQQRL